MSSKRGERRRSCERKKRYFSKAEATIECGRLHRKGVAVHAYKCSFGDHWHIGHKTASQKQQEYLEGNVRYVLFRGSR